jgi:hypothetical protein
MQIISVKSSLAQMGIGVPQNRFLGTAQSRASANRQPIVESNFLDIVGDPEGLLVVFDNRITNLSRLDKPGRDWLVNE